MDPRWQRFAPRLSAENCDARSDPSEDYNCLAFAALDTARWWEPYIVPPERPGLYWPAWVEPDNTIEAWTEALGTVGFAPCADGGLDPTLVKVALYQRGDAAVHAARQLTDGRWVSKLGDLGDILSPGARASRSRPKKARRDRQRLTITRPTRALRRRTAPSATGRFPAQRCAIGPPHSGLTRISPWTSSKASARLETATGRSGERKTPTERWALRQIPVDTRLTLES